MQIRSHGRQCRVVATTKNARVPPPVPRHTVADAACHAVTAGQPRAASALHRTRRRSVRDTRPLSHTDCTAGLFERPQESIRGSQSSLLLSTAALGADVAPPGKCPDVLPNVEPSRRTGRPAYYNVCGCASRQQRVYDRRRVAPPFRQLLTRSSSEIKSRSVGRGETPGGLRGVLAGRRVSAC